MTAVIVKSTVALLLSLAAVLAAKRSRASLRHLILGASFVFLLLLPVVQQFAPAVQIEVKPSVILSEAKDLPARNGEGPSPSSRLRMTPLRNALPLLTILYVSVAFLLLAHLAIGILRLRRLASTAEVWLDGTARMNEIAFAANIRRPALVVLSHDVAVPLTFGFIRSTIVLPDEARHWPDDELTRAIRHELEHVRRDDWMMQLAARAACALYWPQPLVWVAWRRFILEAERACDDAVLGTAEASAYAGQLVSLARNVNRISNVPVLAMASRSKLSTRIEAILDATQRRGPHSRATATIVAVALLAFLVSLAPATLIAETAESLVIDRGLATPGAEALTKAAEAGDVQDVRRLLDAGADIDGIAPGDGTALIGAARGGQMHMIDYLLERGADPNVYSPGDGSPLIAAAREGYTEIVELLLDRDARIDDVVLGDENALMQASMNGNAKLVQLLIRRGANVNARAVERGDVRTPLNLARRWGHDEVERMLLAAGARE
jgi:bla regulator protein blaR1